MSGEQSLEELRTSAVKIMTSAARLGAGDGQQYDIAEFIADVVSSAAANLGDPEALLAGRPGSWEAGYIRDLIAGTIGYDPQDWHTFRTEPIKVTLNVAELIESSDLHPGLLGWDAAGNKACDEIWAELGPSETADQKIDELLTHLERRYVHEYRAYGDRFRTAVRSIANFMKLPAVEMELDVDPESAWWEESVVHNPDPWEDPIVDELWQRAHEAVALPNVDVIRPTGSIEADLDGALP